MLVWHYRVSIRMHQVSAKYVLVCRVYILLVLLPKTIQYVTLLSNYKVPRTFLAYWIHSPKQQVGLLDDWLKFNTEISHTLQWPLCQLVNSMTIERVWIIIFDTAAACDTIHTYGLKLKGCVHHSSFNIFNIATVLESVSDVGAVNETLFPNSQKKKVPTLAITCH